jgi:hypothetical protein
MCNSAHEVWANLEDANRAQASKIIFAYRRKLFHTTAGERDNIIEHLKKLKKYHQQVNFCGLLRRATEGIRSYLQSDHRRIATSFMGLLFESLRQNSGVY